MAFKTEFKGFEIKERFGANREAYPRYEFNLVSWNGKPPMFDIRYWLSETQPCGKERFGGITFDGEWMLWLTNLIVNSDKLVEPKFLETIVREPKAKAEAEKKESKTKKAPKEKTASAKDLQSAFEERLAATEAANAKIMAMLEQLVIKQSA